MRIEISRGFMASDGRAPENISVTIEDERPWMPESLASVICEVMDRMGAIASGSYQAATAMYSPSQARADAEAAEQLRVAVGAPGPSTEPGAYNPHCRRTACGHRQSDHIDGDERGTFLGKGMGECVECDNPDKCRSFVGPSEKPQPEKPPYDGIVALGTIGRGERVAVGLDRLHGVRTLVRVYVGDMAAEAATVLHPGEPVVLVGDKWRPVIPSHEHRRDVTIYRADRDIARGSRVCFTQVTSRLTPMPSSGEPPESPESRGWCVEDVRVGDLVGDFRVLPDPAYGIWRRVRQDGTHAKEADE